MSLRAATTVNCHIRPGADSHSDLGSHHRLDERMLAEQAGGESSSQTELANDALRAAARLAPEPKDLDRYIPRESVSDQLEEYPEFMPANDSDP